MNNYVIYTDGAYSSTRNQGGIGIVILKDNKIVLQYSKMYKDVTNNKMELMAVIMAFTCIKNNVDSIEIVTDSQYVLGCATKGWKRKKNKKLWKLFDQEYKKLQSKCLNITWNWTHGHAENEYNNLCDELAVNASHEIS